MKPSQGIYMFVLTCELKQNIGLVVSSLCLYSPRLHFVSPEADLRVNYSFFLFEIPCVVSTRDCFAQ